MSTEEIPTWGYENEKSKPLSAGQMLLSEPFMSDENFRRSVILISRYHSVEGAVGVILNKPVKLDLEDLLQNFPKGFGGNLSLGGPVGTDLIQMVHTMGHKLTDSQQLCDGIWWGGHFDQLKKLIRQGEITNKQVRFFIGYAGWGATQLIDELKDNSWIICPARHKYIFDDQPDHLWKTVMQDMGGIYQTMASYPESPILN